MTERWECRRQVSGPLVLEKRFIRARSGPGDSDEDRAEIREIQRRCAMWDDPVSRLEVRLAAFAWYGVHYRLSFEDACLPPKFPGVRRELRNFIRRLENARSREGLDPHFRAVMCIEGLHGSGRYHIHFVADGRELSGAQIIAAWRRGDVGEMAALSDREAFRRLAKYFHKERCDGERFPLGCHHVSTRGLPLPPVAVSFSASGSIEVPEAGVVLRQRGPYVTPFGAYSYCKYLLPDASPACRAALRRMKLGGDRGAGRQMSRRLEL